MKDAMMCIAIALAGVIGHLMLTTDPTVLMTV
jgi:hypothetical protein